MVHIVFAVIKKTTSLCEVYPKSTSRSFIDGIESTQRVINGVKNNEPKLVLGPNFRANWLHQFFGLV